MFAQVKVTSDVTLATDADFSDETEIARFNIEIEEDEAWVEFSAPMVLSGTDASQIDWEITPEGGSPARIGGGDLGLVQVTLAASTKATLNPYNIKRMLKGHHLIRLVGQSGSGNGIVEAGESPVFVTVRLLTNPNVNAFNVNAKAQGLQEV